MICSEREGRGQSSGHDPASLRMGLQEVQPEEEEVVGHTQSLHLQPRNGGEGGDLVSRLSRWHSAIFGRTPHHPKCNLTIPPVVPETAPDLSLP